MVVKDRADRSPHGLVSVYLKDSQILQVDKKIGEDLTKQQCKNRNYNPASQTYIFVLKKKLKMQNMFFIL